MKTAALEPSTYARKCLAEIRDCGYEIEVLACTQEGTVLVLLNDQQPLFIAAAEHTPRSDLTRQTFHRVRACRAVIRPFPGSTNE